MLGEHPPRRARVRARTPRSGADKENMERVYPVGRGKPPRAPRPLQFDSLQDLLEQEGYQETRIVTPLAPRQSTDMQRAADDVMADGGAPPTACHRTQRERSAPAAPSDEPAMHAAESRGVWSWMRGLRTTQSADQLRERVQAQSPTDMSGLRRAAPRPASGAPAAPAARAHPGDAHAVPQCGAPTRLRKTQSTGEMRGPRRRRSQIWEASKAYRHQPSEPMPADALERIAAANAPRFAAPPAAPVLSLQDAVAPRNEASMRPSPMHLRRSKSEDMLAKALRGSAKVECRCGQTTPTNGTAARWHAAQCPVREEWVATTHEEVPPPPPVLTVSTPRGVSAPRHLDLLGVDFEPRDYHSHGLRGLLSMRHPRLALVRRATTAGLNALFRGEAQQPLRSARPGSPRRRVRRTPSSDEKRHRASAAQAAETAAAVPDRSGSTQIHALRQCVEERIRSGDATFSWDSPTEAREKFPTLSRFAAASGSSEMGDFSTTHTDETDDDTTSELFESPTIQRAMTRTLRISRTSMPVLRCAPTPPVGDAREPGLRKTGSRVFPRPQRSAITLGLGLGVGADESPASVFARRACAIEPEPAVPSAQRL